MQKVRTEGKKQREGRSNRREEATGGSVGRETVRKHREGEKEGREEGV